METQNGFSDIYGDDVLDDFDSGIAGDEVAFSDEEQEMFEHFRFEIEKGKSQMLVDKYMSTNMV